jgi:Flp pilus assembly protein TadB
MPRNRYDRREKTVPWLIVGILIAGAVLLAVGVVAGSRTLIVTGIAVVALCLLAASVLRRRGVSGPISFAEEFPETTVGPRATTDGDSTPPLDTDPSSRHSRR